MLIFKRQFGEEELRELERKSKRHSKFVALKAAVGLISLASSFTILGFTYLMVNEPGGITQLQAFGLLGAVVAAVSAGYFTLAYVEREAKKEQARIEQAKDELARIMLTQAGIDEPADKTVSFVKKKISKMINKKKDRLEFTVTNRGREVTIKLEREDQAEELPEELPADEGVYQTAGG